VHHDFAAACPAPTSGTKRSGAAGHPSAGVSNIMVAGWATTAS
jgi:hypothetical protein